MNLAGTTQGLVRRWYIVVAGIILAALAGYGAWTHIAPQYERSASQLLMPGAGSLPSHHANPYLYIGGLLQAADVVVRVAGTNDVVTEMVQQHPGTQISVVRDPGSSGPVILTSVSASSDAVTKELLNKVLAQTAVELDKLQTAENIDAKDRISVRTLSIDQKPTLQQRKRLVATGGASVGVLGFSLVLASLIDGLSRIRARRKDATADESGPPVPPDLLATNSAKRGAPTGQPTKLTNSTGLEEHEPARTSSTPTRLPKLLQSSRRH